MPALTQAEIRDMARWHKEMRNSYEWKLTRFVFPKKCFISNEWSGFFSEMYVGRRKSRWLPNHQASHFRRLVSKDAFLIMKLKGETLF